MSLRPLRGKGYSLSTFIDQIVPRQRFGSSVFNTPLLLFVRLLFQAAPVDQNEPPRPIRAPAVARKPWPFAWLASGYTARDTQWGTWCPGLETDDPNGITSKISTNIWRSRLRDESYPIKSSSVLQSITWIHSLSSPLSHEYIQCVLNSPESGKYRVIVERDTYGDWIYAVANSSPAASNTANLSASSDLQPLSTRKVETMLPDDEHHGSPLPLLSLSWSHIPQSERPTAGNLATVLEKVTQSSPRYNILREHCWWFAEAVFEEMLHARSREAIRSHREPAMLKQWPWASYRYSYIVVGKKIFKRDVLLQEAAEFREMMDEDGRLQW